MDRAGNTLVYTYNDFADKSFPGLVSIESSTGQKIDITMQEVNGKWVVTAIETNTSPALSWAFSYPGGYLTAMVNPEGGATIFAYGKLKLISEKISNFRLGICINLRNIYVFS